MINYGGIPFEIKAKKPNAMAAAAITELESGQGNSAENIAAENIEKIIQ